MTYFQIGSLAIPSLWLAVVSSLFLSSVTYRIINRRKLGEWYWNGFFLYFITWKLSYILFQFDFFFDMPLSIVYFNGGIKGHFAALAFLSIYLLLLAKKKYPSINKEAPGAVFLFFLMYIGIIHLLEKNENEALMHFIILTGFILLLLLLKKNKTILTTVHMIIVLLIELLIFSLFSSVFTTEPITFIWLGLTVLILAKNWTRGSTEIE
jgi:hypothetical protein